MTVLEITDLTKVVNQKTLLNNINLLLTSSHIYVWAYWRKWSWKNNII